MTKQEYLEKISKMNTSEKRKSKLIKRYKQEYIEECCAAKVGSKFKTFRGYEVIKSIDIDENGDFVFITLSYYSFADILRTEKWMSENYIKVRK